MIQWLVNACGGRDRHADAFQKKYTAAPQKRRKRPIGVTQSYTPENTEYCPFIGDEANQVLKKLKEARPSKEVTMAALSYLKIGDEAMAWVADAVSKSRTVKHVHLQHNLISSEGLALLVEGAKRCTTLTDLHLGYNSIDNVDTLADLLDAGHVHSLILTRNTFHGDDSLAFAEAVRRNRGLRTLDLSGNHIGDTFANELANGLLVNKYLTTVDLFGSQLTDASGEALAAMLGNNGTLLHLNLGANSLSDPSAKAFAMAIASNTSLRELNLVQNVIGDSGAEALATQLPSNTSLTSLNLGLNRLTPSGVAALDAVRAARPQHLRYVNLYDNPGTTAYYSQMWKGRSK